MRSLATTLLLLAVAPLAIAAASEPIANFRELPVHTRGKNPSPSQVREAIIAAGRQVATLRNNTWQITENEPGQLVGRIQWSRHSAEVAITYSPERYSIVYRGSDNLDYDKERQSIHPTYNRLVRALAFQIQSTLRDLEGEPERVIPASVLRAPAVPGPGGESQAVALSLTASAETKRSRAWPALIAEWRNHAPAAVEQVGASLFSMQEAEPAAMGRPGTLVSIHVNSFRYISPARRYAKSPAGQIDPNKGALDVKVQFFDLMSGNPIGTERAYAAAAPGTGGDFAETTNLQVRNMVHRIMRDWRDSPAAEPRAAPPVARPVTASGSDRAEVSFWESVRDSKNPVELQAYLDSYPNGVFAPLARARLAALKR